MPLEGAMQLTATIAQSASLSNAVLITGRLPTRIDMPAAWTAANLTFQVSTDGLTYNNLYGDAGTEYTVTAAAARAIVLDPVDFAGVNYLKIRSGTAATPVAQEVARSLAVVTRTF